MNGFNRAYNGDAWLWPGYAINATQRTLNTLYRRWILRSAGIIGNNNRILSGKWDACSQHEA